jgi:DNA-binding CsgD family transcriptional regulator
MEEKVSKKELVVFIIVCAGFGLHWFTCYASIPDSSLQYLNYSVWTRVFRIVCTFFFAVLLLGHKRLPRICFTTAVVIQLATWLVAPILPSSLIAARNFIYIIEGYPIAVFYLLFAQFIGSYPPSYSRNGAFAAFALAHCVITINLLFPMIERSSLFAFLLGVSLLTLVLGVCQRRLLVPTKQFFESYEVPMLHVGRLKNWVSHEKADGLPKLLMNTVVYGTGVVILPLLYSIMSQISYYADINQGINDLITQFFCVIALLILLLVSSLRHKPMPLSTTFTVMLPAVATVLLLTPFFWNNTPFSSSIVIKCAYALYFAVLFTSLTEKGFKRPERALTYYALATGFAVLMLLVGREIGYSVYTRVDFNFASISGISLVAIWMLIIVSSVFVRVFAKTRLHATSDTDTDQNGQTVADHASSLSLEKKAQLFSHLNGLSKRETEILLLYTRGRSASYISSQLYISESTVRTYLARIYRKAEVHDRQSLINKIESTFQTLPPPIAEMDDQ